MKNKKIKYVLIPIVIVVWGIVFYKVFNFSNDDTVNYSISEPLIEASYINSEPDSFQLSLSYADPFLKKTRIVKTKYEQAELKAKREAVLEKNRMLEIKEKRLIQKRFKPTKIKYGGEITNNNSNHLTAVIRIQDKNKLLTDGDLVGDVEIVKIYNDSVQVKDQGVQRTIFKH